MGMETQRLADLAFRHQSGSSYDNVLSGTPHRCNSQALSLLSISRRSWHLPRANRLPCSNQSCQSVEPYRHGLCSIHAFAGTPSMWRRGYATPGLGTIRSIVNIRLNSR